jgi:hypothetical protein
LRNLLGLPNFEMPDSSLVNLRDARKGADVLSILGDGTPQFPGSDRQQLNGLGQRLMPLGEPVDPFLNVMLNDKTGRGRFEGARRLGKWWA